MSTETKRYRLLKDLPYVKAGAIYQFDEGDTYVCDTETAQFTDGTKWDALGALAVENAAEGWFELIPEQSKMPKQERIEVLLLDGVQHTFGQKAVRNFYDLETSKPIPTPLIPKIKQAIEQALNPTTDTNTVSKVKELERLVEYYEAEFNANSDKIYTQQEVDEMREETWLAARETEYDMDYDNPPIKKKYKELSDYLNSINPENKASTNPTPTEQTKSDVLFTTEDGVPVYDGKVCWWVNTTYESYWGKSQVVVNKTKDGDYDFKSGKYFASESAIDQYIIDNKPCLSLKEVYDGIWNATLVNVSETCNTNDLRRILNEKAKQSKN